MTTSWTYGEAGERFPVRRGEVWRAGRHLFSCSDLMEETLFDSLLEGRVVDLVYSDPPWGQALANGFRTKAGLGRATYHWTDIYRRVARFAHREGHPAVPVWVECSKESHPDGQQVRGTIMHPDSPYYSYAELTYYNNPKQLMGLFAATPTAVPESLLAQLRGKDDSKTPDIVMRYYGETGLVVDPCTGLGQTPRSAEAVGWSSLNNDLNPHRISSAMASLRVDVERVG